MNKAFSVSDNAPHWVKDNTQVQRILHNLLDQIEHGNKHATLYVKNTLRKGIPELFNFNNDPDELWLLISNKLAREHNIITIKLKPKRAIPLDAEPYFGATLTLNPNSETQLRAWLNRAVNVGYSTQWQQALDHYAPHFDAIAAFNAPIKHGNLTAKEIVAGFAGVADLLKQAEQCSLQLSLRNVSARCFSGDSKFLDKRRAFLEHALPNSAKFISPRAIMMSVSIPITLEAALFVENFDSFRSTVAALKRSKATGKVAVVYSAGYRVSANVIRHTGNSQFVTINHATQEQYEQFEHWWFSGRQDVPVYFWGDLDYEGMGILKALRGRFVNAQSFIPAYALSLEYHSKGVCHAPDQTNKSHQNDPQLTGCDYADNVLLPAMRDSTKFTDQEVVNEDELVGAINAAFGTLNTNTY